MSPSISHTLPDLTGEFIDDGSLELIALLGCGAYGKVYKARDTLALPDEPAFYAVKCMPRYEPHSRGEKIQEEELLIHRMVSDHPRIITFYRAFATDDYVFVVLELCEGGDFFGAMVDRECFRGNPHLIKKAFNEILDSVDFLHRNSVFHRDIKPENILCNSAGTDIRLADFGLATQTAITNQFGCGSRYYMSPESLDPTNPDGCYSARYSDMWAISVLFTNLISGRHPWSSADPSDPGYAAFCSNNNYLLRALKLTREANALLKRCFHPDPRRRPSIPQFRASVNEIELFSLDDQPQTLMPLSPPPCIPPPELSTALSLEWAVAAPSSPVPAAAPVPEETPRPAQPIHMPQPIQFTAFMVQCSSSASSSFSFVTLPASSSPASPTATTSSATTSELASDSSSLPSSASDSDMFDTSDNSASYSSPPTTPASTGSESVISCSRASTGQSADDLVSILDKFPAPPRWGFLGPREIPPKRTPGVASAAPAAPHHTVASSARPRLPVRRPVPPIPQQPAHAPSSTSVSSSSSSSSPSPAAPRAPIAICKPGEFRSVASPGRPTLPMRKQFLSAVRIRDGQQQQ